MRPTTSGGKRPAKKAAPARPARRPSASNVSKATRASATRKAPTAAQTRQAIANRSKYNRPAAKKITSSGGLNLNPFDPNNSISRAGSNVARGIEPGLARKIPGRIGDAIRGATPQGQLFDKVGNRIKQVTGQR